MIDDIARWIGYAAMLVGGVALVAAIFTAALNYVWRLAQNAYGLKEMLQAYRDSRREPELRRDHERYQWLRLGSDQLFIARDGKRVLGRNADEAVDAARDKDAQI